MARFPRTRVPEIQARHSRKRCWWLMSREGRPRHCRQGAPGAQRARRRATTQARVFLSRRYTSPDFLYIRSWLPCIFFSGGVTVGNIGRQLAMVREMSPPPRLEGSFIYLIYLFTYWLQAPHAEVTRPGMESKP